MSWLSLVSPKYRHASSQGGFGLVELMVSISIMVIVMGVVLIRQSSFNSAVLLRSQAYEIALQLREVQLSAVSVSNLGAGDNFRQVLGVHFSTSDDGLYRIFRDSTFGPEDNNYYDEGEEFGIQGKLDERFEIREIRALGTVTNLSIVFERPNFDAVFYGNSGEIVTSSIQIKVAKRDSAGDVCGTDYRTVEVTSTGQIAVLECS